MKSKINPTVILILSFAILLSGCDAFVRKFTRKPKKGNLPKEEMVLEPQEYNTVKPGAEELYRQYFLYWKSWHDEFINALTSGASHKKQIDCAAEAIKNLNELKSLLNEAAQEKLAVYIRQLKSVSDLITADIYGNNIAQNRFSLERIKRDILRDFSYDKVRKSLL